MDTGRTLKGIIAFFVIILYKIVVRVYVTIFTINNDLI
jgi:hypothetical protein